MIEKRGLILFVLVLIMLSGCAKEKPPEEKVTIEPPEGGICEGTTYPWLKWENVAC